jgi:uncharacterized membrane protein
MPAEDVKIEIPSTSNREPTTVGILSPVRRISSPPVKEYEEVTSDTNITNNKDLKTMDIVWNDASEMTNDQSQRIIEYIKEYFHFPIRKKGLPLLFAAIYFVSCGFWNSLVQVYIQNLVIQRGLEHTKPLFDLGFYIFPYVTFALAADYYMTALICIVLLKTFLFQKVGGTLHVCRRLLVIHGTAFLLRSISISITLLPNPWVQCQPQTVDNYFVGAFLVMAGTHRTCSDCFFSGHSVMIALSGLIWFTYTDSKYMLVRLAIIPLALGGGFVLISTHFHYTVDVLYGCFVGVGIWTTYHYVANMVEKWLTERLYRAYILHQHTNKQQTQVTYSELAAEFLSFDDDKDMLFIVKKSETDLNTSNNEEKKTAAFIFVSKEEQNGEHNVITQEQGVMKSRSADLLHAKMRRIEQENQQRRAKRAYYYKLKHFLAMVLLRFLVWFESWEDFLLLDFHLIEEEHIQNPAPATNNSHRVIDPDVLQQKAATFPVK